MSYCDSCAALLAERNQLAADLARATAQRDAADATGRLLHDAAQQLIAERDAAIARADLADRAAEAYARVARLAAPPAAPDNEVRP